MVQQLTSGRIDMRPGETLSSANVANLTQHVEGMPGQQVAVGNAGQAGLLDDT